ncbi:type III-B CRISPR-associated protein Cas10/Cmr2 [Aliarcobacter butzleri]
MNYIALTIGPIYDTIFDTLNGENKTKKLKTGSYYFSFFMKTLLKNIKDDFDILVPYVDGEALTKEYKSMGLFHDRFIAQSEKSEKDIRDIFKQKEDMTFKELAKYIQDESIFGELKKNMTNHLLVASSENLKKIDENIIFAINKVLDSKELQREFSLIPETNWIKKYQENELKKSSVKTIEDLSSKLGFDYYAVITADGDKIGAKIKTEATQNPENIKNLSEKLYNFFTKDSDIYTITNKDFKGELIYAGGDDILAFIPVKQENKTFLDYIKVLDERFKQIVGEDVSLSFGINIAYYKYPLRDAIKSAFDLLYESKSDSKIKNRVSIKITKHSGQWFKSTLCLNEERYSLYKKLTDNILENNITLPHSLHHTLKRYEEAILSTYKQDNSSSIKPLFDTVFNDSKGSDKSGIEFVQKYLDVVSPQKNKDFDTIFSELSIIKFLREDRK